jgi:hypothetical protein
LEDIAEDKDGIAVIRLEQGNELLIERSEENHFYRISIQAAHEHQPGKVIPLDLNEESDGTRRLLNLLPALHYLQTGNAVFLSTKLTAVCIPFWQGNFWNFLKILSRRQAPNHHHYARIEFAGFGSAAP